jgi:hypothetical protein
VPRLSCTRPLAPKSDKAGRRPRGGRTERRSLPARRIQSQNPSALSRPCLLLLVGKDEENENMEEGRAR